MSDYVLGSDRSFCKNCRCERDITASEPWSRCTGSGPHRAVQCQACGFRFTQWKNCTHREGTYDCDVWRKS